MPSALPSMSPSEKSSESPSASPSESPSFSRRTMLSNLFVSYNVSIEDLQDSSSPQYSALDWMAETDSASGQADLSSDQLVERFALVMLYYATGGINWSDQVNFLSPSSDICNWKGQGDRGVLGCNDEGSVVRLGLCKFPDSSTC